MKNHLPCFSKTASRVNFYPEAVIFKPVKIPDIYKLVSLVAMTLAVLALSMSGCGETKATGPDAAVERFIHLLNAREFGQAYDSLAQSSRYRVMTRSEFIQENERYFPSNAAAYRLSDLVTSDVLIEDDAATVSWSGTWVTGIKGEKGDTIDIESTLINEDGEWKIVDLWGE